VPGRNFISLSVLLCLTVAVCAQTEKIVAVRMLDGKTGHPIETANLLVRVDRQETVHADWALANDEDKSEPSRKEEKAGKHRTEDKTATEPSEEKTVSLKLPPGAAIVSIHATYDGAMKTYVNCDSAKDKQAVDRWYKIAEILATGVEAPNGCGKAKAAAKPGEFVFYVRQQNWHEQWKDE
jgi:hypothetical protein